ncbi:3-oxoadipate CoA-transferase subunit B [Comamonas sp. PE63]|uniref:3-oxoadipate CoA-transferase subunit B n=1 Tax=Comamonas brasiliensis TaxID=1812482 RepID=A0ABS5LQQ7_9BURK|nr:3-oxoacid CoA-transferase subunit B [Comamonas sp. PE63]MBS3018845.1 3-oxoadipate CoA-transferase subunit B [Comamonas sp. PE63]
MSTYTIKGRSRQCLARRVADDIENGWYVNLGIGLPELVASHIRADKSVILHSENGLLGMGGPAAPEAVDWDLINAGKKPVTLLRGGCYFDHVSSFTMMRGGHLDLCILGAFQVSEQGDLANWWTGDPDELPAVGGAMDLVAGARKVFVIMDHLTRDGSPKLVSQCSYPLTGASVVDRVYTDLAVIDITLQGMVVQEMADSLDFTMLQEITQAPLRAAPDMKLVSCEDRRNSL